MTLLAPECVYTMRNSGDLDACVRSGGTGSFTEHKRWVTASKLFGRATTVGEEMPIVFSAAERDSGLIYWALLTNISVDDGDPAQGIGLTTTYSFRQLASISPPRKLSELRLLSSGSPLADTFIRPYAICHTPSFLS